MNKKLKKKEKKIKKRIIHHFNIRESCAMKILGKLYFCLVFLFFSLLVSSKKGDLDSHQIDKNDQNLSHSSTGLEIGSTKRVTRVIKNTISGLVHAPLNVLFDFFINGLSDEEPKKLTRNAQVDHYHVYSIT